MNQLLIQFLLIAILPLSLIGLALYTWQQRPPHRQLAAWWTLTLLATALWASRLLTFYLGADVGAVVSYNWRLAGNYALTLSGTFLLITTTLYLARPRRWAHMPGLLLWLLALGIDPAIWYKVYVIPKFDLSGLMIDQFDLWAVAWVLSWALPTLLAWITAEQALRNLPKSLYRSQANYWFITVTMFGIGGMLALLRDMLIPQQLGAMLLILAALLGSIGVSRDQLADLQGRLQHYSINVARGIVIFFMAWGALTLLSIFITGTLPQSSALVVGAAIFAVMILLLLTVSDRLTRRMMGISEMEHAADMGRMLDTGSNLLPPATLARLGLEWLNAHLHNEGSWVMETADAPGGGLILRPTAALGESASQPLPQPAIFSSYNPFAEYLRTQTRPLLQRDIDALTYFLDMLPEERNIISGWRRVVFVPVRAGQRLIAVLGLQDKSGDEPYIDSDFDYLEALAAQLGRLLAQSHNLHAVLQVNEFVFSQNQRLGRDNRRLQELVNLHGQFTELLSPELRRPFTDLEVETLKLQQHLAENKALQNGELKAQEALQSHIVEAQAMVDNLIAVASHLEKQRQFNFAPVEIDAVLRAVIRNLEGMAEARRVVIVLDLRGKLLPVYGDAQRLVEALQQLLHNAIKFNRIGGEVRITGEMRRNELRLQIRDRGVGIPDEKMPELWTGLTKLFGAAQGMRRRTRVGLPLVRFIIQSHGGRVEAESDYGTGTTFTIYLPALLEDNEA